ncbi:FtsX-like permease family protein [Yinghuangia seranimata]|uniref:FtsX-like permease family protein n=1 Tax=Yinghuangia seranimata TaxID=408067 RepID=UPI00248C1AF7|nr:FtsX-like permease family protein [Yinghuangia seranimata]MDI2131922.1 FtsX-like permease family protein [Yinghuangia seranimata]
MSALTSWRAALRIARREAWRAKGRSLLIVLMVALPVFAAAAADITYRSQQLDLNERLERVIGQAEARLRAEPLPIAQDPLDFTDRVPEYSAPSIDPATGRPGPYVPPPPGDPKAFVPPGAAVLTEAKTRVIVRTGYGLASVDWREFDYAAPLARGIVTQVEGRAPNGPDEVAVTVKLLHSGGLRIGGTLADQATGTVFRIVGTVELPDSLRAVSVITKPGALLDRLPPGAVPPADVEYLVAGPTPFTWDKVLAANGKGVAVQSRSVAEHPPPDSQVPFYRQDLSGAKRFSDLAMAVGVVVVGMALLEVVLLAGPAFAVGARRRRRDFGLVGVVGGDARHIRTIVLADGVFLGGLAGLVGGTGGLLAAWLSRDWFSETSGKRLGHYDVRPLEVVAVVVLGVLIGLVAAAVPAFLAARESVASSLSDRRGVRRGSRLLPAAGLVVCAAGLGLAYYGARSNPDDTVLLAGCTVAELGVIACCPALLGLAGRLGRLLPLTPRLALRDAARNRPRTAPAVAAVMAAVAGATAVAAYWASVDHDARLQYQAVSRPGQVSVTLDSGTIPAGEHARTIIEQTLPVTGDGPVRGLRQSCPFDQACDTVSLTRPPANRCPAEERMRSEPMSTGAVFMDEETRKDPRCRPQIVRGFLFGTVVGGVSEIQRINGAVEPGMADALKHGVVVFDPLMLDAEGKVTVLVSRNVVTSVSSDGISPTGSPAPPPPPTEVRLPGRVFAPPEGGSFVQAVFGEEAARATGVETVTTGLLYDTRRMPTEAEVQHVQDMLVTARFPGWLHVERGYQGRPSTQILLLAASALVVALGAVAVATGLALADGRADLATLGAVGAPPYVRRMLSAAQSWTIALIGTALGLVVGLLPAAALRWKTTDTVEELARVSGIDPPGTPLVVPWGQMGLALLVLPLVAAALAALFTRSRAHFRTRRA